MENKGHYVAKLIVETLDLNGPKKNIFFLKILKSYKVITVGF